jgi:hypothetical protein
VFFPHEAAGRWTMTCQGPSAADWRLAWQSRSQCPVADLPPGAVTGAGPYAIGNIDGKYFAVTRRCRHLRADLVGGSIEERSTGLPVAPIRL